MGRESDPSSQANSRFRVWNALGDLYSHTELAENWDTLDAIIGRPTDGSTWPPMDERGINGGIYAYLKSLEDSQDKVGATKFMWWPASAGNIADFIPDKWAALNGQTILAANHDFPTDDDIVLPDSRNTFVIGADATKGAGVAGSATDLASGAPGVVQLVGGLNVGGGGSNATSHTHTIPAHEHSVPSHAHTVSGHSHDMDHRHSLIEGALTSGTPAHAQAIYELTRSAVKVMHPVNGENLGTLGWNPGSAGSITPGSWPPALDVGGTDANPLFDKPYVAHAMHTHFPRSWAGAPKAPAYTSSNPVVDRTTTGETALTTSTASAASTTGGSASTTGFASLDNRPRHIGLVMLVKVRN